MSTLIRLLHKLSFRRKLTCYRICEDSSHRLQKILVTLGTQRPQLEQRMGLTWPRPCLLRPPLRLLTVCNHNHDDSATMSAKLVPNSQTSRNLVQPWLNKSNVPRGNESAHLMEFEVRIFQKLRKQE